MADTPIQAIGDEYAVKISEAFQKWAEEAQAAYPQIVPFDPTPIILAAMLAAGEAQTAELAALLEVKIEYDLISPEAIAWAKKYGADQVKYVHAGTKAAIRQITLSGLRDGLSPQAQRKAIKQLVGLLPQHVIAVQNYRDQLFKSGMDEASVDRLAAKKIKKLLNWRASNIGLTESHTSANEGMRRANEDAVKRGVLDPKEYEQEWVVSGLKNVCEKCLAMSGKRAPIGGTFSNGSRGPPIHPSDHCGVVLVRK